MLLVYDPYIYLRLRQNTSTKIPYMEDLGDGVYHRNPNHLVPFQSLSWLVFCFSFWCEIHSLKLTETAPESICFFAFLPQTTGFFKGKLLVLGRAFLLKHVDETPLGPYRLISLEFEEVVMMGYADQDQRVTGIHMRFSEKYGSPLITVGGRNPANQLICSLSHYLQCFIHARWLFGISSINSITGEDASKNG